MDPTWILGDLKVLILDEETDIVKTVGTLVFAASFGEVAVTVNGLLQGAGSAARVGLSLNSGNSVVLHSNDGATLVIQGVHCLSSLQASRIAVGPRILVVPDPMLTSLGDHGGPTLTRRPLAGSLVIDAGSISPHSKDQRSFPRPIGHRADIGAVERGSSNSFGLCSVEVLVFGSASFTGADYDNTDPQIFLHHTAALADLKPANPETLLSLAYALLRAGVDYPERQRVGHRKCRRRETQFALGRCLCHGYDPHVDVFYREGLAKVDRGVDGLVTDPYRVGCYGASVVSEGAGSESCR